MKPRALIALLAAIAAAAAVAAWLVHRVGGFGTSETQVAMLDPARVIVLRTPGGLLEVATLRKTEEFGWQTTHTCPLLDCGKLLGGTVTRVRVPVNYVYRVPLAATWELRPEGDHHVLEVPAVQPALPPGIDTAKLEMQTTSGWFSPDRELNVQSTLRQLGPELQRRATLPEYLKMQEASAAQTVAEFARKWLREQGQPAPAKIRVVFRSGGA